MIKTLSELYQRFDDLYGEMVTICKNCVTRNCEDYAWFLPEKFDNLEPTIKPQQSLGQRMYPVGLITVHGKMFFVLFTNCQYYMAMSYVSKMAFTEKVFDIFDDCSLDLYDTIIAAYLAADNSFKCPQDEKEYEILTSCRDLRIMISRQKTPDNELKEIKSLAKTDR